MLLFRKPADPAIRSRLGIEVSVGQIIVVAALREVSRAVPAKVVRQEGALSVEEANERTVRAQGQEIPLKFAVIEEIARGTGRIGADRIEVEGGKSLLAAEHRPNL
jgi:hypothetical protein